MNINSNERMHQISIMNSKNIYKLENCSKDWTKGFRLKVNNKTIEKSLESRIELTKLNYIDLTEIIKTKRKNINVQNYIETHKICGSVQRKCQKWENSL